MSVYKAARSGDHVKVMEAARDRLARDIDECPDPNLAGQLIDRLVRVQAGLFVALDRATGSVTVTEDEVEAARRARAERRAGRRAARGYLGA